MIAALMPSLFSATAQKVFTQSALGTPSSMGDTGSFTNWDGVVTQPCGRRRTKGYPLSIGLKRSGAYEHPASIDLSP